MTPFEILIPFAIPPAPIAIDLQRELRTPSLACLLGKSKLAFFQKSEEFSEQLPHEQVLSGQLSSLALYFCGHSNQVPQPKKADTINKMHGFGLSADVGFWFEVNPVHIHIARDHLVLTDQRRLSMRAEDAGILFDAAAALCQELGKTLVYGDAKTWFLRADDWQDMRTSSKDAACGHNIDIWMPKGAQELAWRKLQNEIQMQWFIHPINAQREERGERIINSIWLSGGASAATTLPKVQPSDAPLADTLKTNKEGIYLLAQLLEPALNSDWAEWIEQANRLESSHFLPLLGALKNGQLRQLSLISTDATRVARHTVSHWDLKKFWKPDSLQPLFRLASR